MNAAMLMLVASTFAAPQAPSNTLGATPGTRLMSHTTFVQDAKLLLSQTTAGGAKAKGTVAGKAFSLAVQGGLTFNAGTGFLVGVGMSLQPGGNEHVEVMGDFNFGRVSGSNLFYISFNGLYDLNKTSSGMTPFVGGGLSIYHFSVNCGGFAGCSGTSTSFQLIGGIQLAGNSEHVMRLSVRFLLNGGNPIVLMFGYSF
jgi:hypothetical protein